MSSKVLFATLFLLLASLTCFGQTSYQGLTPSRSTRADVERVLGAPVQSVSKKLIEYKSPGGAGKVYVQYRDESPAAFMERVEVLCGPPARTCEAVRRAMRLELPPVPHAQQYKTTEAFKDIGNDRVIRYYGSPLYVVTTGTAGRPDVERIAVYSRELYKVAAPRGCTGTFAGMGRWDTTRGRLTFTKVEGDQVAGTYSEYHGSFTGTAVDGNFLGGERKGTWEDDTGSGEFSMKILPGGERLIGRWWHTDGRRTNGKNADDWEGRCVEAIRASKPGSDESSNGEGEKVTPLSSRAEVVRGGVLDEKAVSKPNPSYPAMAKAAHASGRVVVQVVVDESGGVISATAVLGHPLLHQAAITAARQARFPPTLIGGKRVKVSGVLTYDFAP